MYLRSTGFILAVVILALLGFQAFLSLRHLRVRTEHIVHSHEVIGRLEHLAETCRRADLAGSEYIASHSDFARRRYEAGRAEIDRDLQHLHRLTLRDPEQNARVGRLRKVIAQALPGQPRSSIPANVNPELGSPVLDHVLKLVNEIEVEQRRKLDEGTAQAVFEERALQWSTALGSVVALVAVSGSWYLIHRGNQRRQQVEDSLREQSRISDTLYYVAGALAGEVDPQQIAETVAGAAADVTGAQVGAFFHEFRSSPDQTRPLYALAGHRQRALDVPAMKFGPEFDPGRSVLVDDLSEQSIAAPALLPDDVVVRSFLAVPIRSRADRTVGAIVLGHAEPRAFSQHDLRLVEGIAAQAAVAVERASLYTTEQLARTEAERANRAKDHFLAVLSHELRTPLTPVMTMSQLLETDSAIPAHVQDALAMIRRNVEMEARLIDDLLDLTRITRGKLDIHATSIDLHESLRHVLRSCEDEIRAKGLRLAVEPNATRTSVLGDPTRVQQVLWNLLKNAMKFTPRGGSITIRTQSAVDEVWLQIADTGVGIEPDVLPRIFDAFEQGGDHVTRLFGGLGLGLSISKALVELHGGKLEAHSDGKDRGSTFTLTLPLAEAPAGTTLQTPSEPMFHFHGRVLLVEDHLDTAKALARLLSRYGFEVRTATSVASALSVAGAEPLDLVISDIGLPDGSGLDLMRQLLARYHVRGIALSGYGMDEDIRRSREAGFVEHLVKPVSKLALEQALERVIATEVASRS